MFGFDAIFRMLLAIKSFIMLGLILLLLLGNYVQHELHKGTKAELKGVRAELSACEKFNQEVNKTEKSSVQYQKEMGGVLDKYYKTMPKKPDLGIFPDDDSSADSSGMRRQDPPSGGQRLPDR